MGRLLSFLALSLGSGLFGFSLLDGDITLGGSFVLPCFSLWRSSSFPATGPAASLALPFTSSVLRAGRRTTWAVIGFAHREDRDHFVSDRKPGPKDPQVC